MTIIKFCNRIIEYSFYALFLLVPLVFTSATSELFELNKMWLTWGLTIIIATSWLTKMVLQKKIIFQKTPLDLPILLFLLSQITSTVFSLDSHVSFWGYYSRFNGGLLSTITYILLFYAFLSNFPTLAKVQKLMTISLISGLIVALWGFPSHFGFDPTCAILRFDKDISFFQNFNVDCWTADFMPKIRIFSTLGQPAWLAAYLAILIPISIAFFINNLKSNSSSPQVKNRESGIMNYELSRKFIYNSLFIILASLFYVDLLFTRTRSGFLGVAISLLFFFAVYFFMQRKKINLSFFTSHLSFLIGLLLFITFVIGTPITQLDKFTFSGIKNSLFANKSSNALTTKAGGGTDSGNIRKFVWKGAVNSWLSHPILGTGVETFAFAYYRYRPAAHNLTSEWNFLYNKAHNEYLNYLATTGIVGLGTYLAMIAWFIYLSIKQFKIQSAKLKIAIQNSKFLTFNSNFSLLTLNFALLASYISILITNFFGFSVVITNIYLFMIPAFVFILSGILPRNESGIPTTLPLRGASKNYESSNLYQWMSIFFILVTCLFLLITLFRFWQADVSYSRGYNLDRAGEYQTAYPYLQEALKLRGSEPVFKDEFSVNNAIIAAGLIAQINENTDKVSQEQIIVTASKHAQDAINTSNEVISKHPNNVVFWKTRTKLFHTLSQVDSRYLPRTQDAIEKAALIAPNDANIWYNLGVLYGQNNNIEKGIEALEKAVNLKLNYQDARIALGLFYRKIAIDENGQVINPEFNKKAIDQMQYILDHLNPSDSVAKESIANWTK